MLVLLLLLIPAETHAMTVVTPTQNVTSTKYFTAFPGVYEMGDGYAVIWATNFSGTGYIKYTYGGVNYTVYDTRNNIVRTNDTIHVVKVPHEHLQGNTYTVYSTEVTSHQYAITNYGTTVSAGPIRLKAYDGGVNDFDVLVLTDTHGQLNWTKTVAAQFSEDPDLVVFSGDIVDSIESKATIAKMFNIMGTTTGGRYPIVYCRGNHETRGIWSTALLEYFPTKTGEFYFDFRYGPLWGVVMDTGEDKEDTHEYYGNLSNYGEYNQKQERWLRSLRRDETATYRLGIYHIARLHDLKNNGIDFTDSIGHLGLQFGITGHFHSAEIYNKTLNKATSIRHDAFVCGGYAIDAATMLTMDRTTNKAYVTVKKSNGSIYGGFNNYPIALSSYIGSVPGALSEPNRGLNAQFNPTASPKGTVSITVEPTVFETGGDWYNIVWATSTTNSSAKGTTGYVEYEYQGVKYQMFDEIGGYRRSNSNIHTVRVPKEHLNNNKYKVGSFLIQYSYTNPSAQTGRYYTAGDYVVSKEYVFEDRSNDKAVNIIACPDGKFQNNSTTHITAFQNAVAGLGTSPAYVVMNGDLVGITLDTNDDLVSLFKATSYASGGIHPVIFSRGNAECRGYLATELIKYIPTVTGEFYYSVDVGDYTFVNIDTAEDDPDDQWIAWQGSTVRKYGNRVTFDALRKQQLDWINSMPSGKLVALSHMPLSTAKSHLGVDFESALKAKGAVLCIGAHDEVYTLEETVNANSVYTIIPGGFNNASSYNVAVSVLLADDYAHINASKYQNGTTTRLDSKTVSLTTGKEISYSATKPSLVNGVYVLSTPGHIKWMSQNCNSLYGFSGSKFELANDIDMMLVPFTPIGGNDSVSTDNNTSSYGFGGSFNGNGYTIKNVNIDSSKNNVGFFGFVRYGEVNNLTVSSGMVDGGWYVGGLVGSSYGGTFENCYSDLTVYSAGGSKVGGFAGFLSHGSSVNRCANFGHVSAHHSGGSAGGIVGQVYSATTNDIYNSFNRGAIAAHGASGIAGGIMGYSGNVAADIVNCYNAASVTSPGSQGAIMGGYSSSGEVYVGNTYFATGFNGAAMATKTSNSWSTSAGSGTISGLSQSTMKSQTLAKWLGSSEFVYVASMNDGYPIHTTNLHSSGSPEHSYVPVVTAPTCTQPGYTTYTCECGDSYTADEVPATGHVYTKVVTAPTCTKAGYTTYTCKCGDSYTANPVAATGHSYTKTVTAPTCTEAGYTTYTCKCGDSYVADQVAATGHDFRNGSCADCGEADPDYVAPVVSYALVGDMNNWDASANIMTGEKTLSVTVTLAEGTYQFKINDGQNAYGNDGVIVNTTAATSADGWLMNQSAGNCTLVASGGDYKFTFDPATCLLVITYLTDETENAPVPNGIITLKSVTLSLEDEIVYNIYFETENMTVSEKDMGLIIWDSEPVLATINGGGTVIEGATYLPVSNRYGISSMGIPAKNMADLKYMVVYARQSDGSYVYSRLLQYSAKTYCLNRVQKSENENMRAVCVALMNFGAEAQKYFAATTDYTYTTLMNVGFEEYQYLVKAYDSDLLNLPTSVDAAKAGIFGTTANGFSARSVSMSADGTFALNYYFTPSVEVDGVTFYYWTAEQYASVSQLTAANASGTMEMSAGAVANKYWACIDGIAAKDMDQTIYACGVYEVDGVTYTTGVIPYSIARYCMNKVSAGSEIQDFAAATAVYGYHAKCYFYG